MSEPPSLVSHAGQGKPKTEEASVSSPPLESCDESDDGYDSFGDESIIDIDTFELPPFPECPVCMLLMPQERKKIMHMACCGQMLCGGCVLESGVKGEERGLTSTNANRCPLCRAERFKNSSDCIAAMKQHAERGDKHAVCNLAGAYEYGLYGLTVHKKKAIDLYHRAVTLGDPEAALFLGWKYESGDGVKTDRQKAKRLYSMAAKGGSPRALYYLGKMEEQEKKCGFVKYFCLASAGGVEESIKSLKPLYKEGLITKEEYGNALRAYQAAQMEMKSVSRDVINGYVEKRFGAPPFF